MPHFHCRCCHHEFDGPSAQSLACDWCGADRPRVLEEVTPFEAFFRELLERLRTKAAGR